MGKKVAFWQFFRKADMALFNLCMKMHVGIPPKNLTFAAKGFKMMNRVVPMMEAKRTTPKRIDNQTLPSSPLSSVSCSTGQSFSDRDFRKKKSLDFLTFD